MDSIISQPVKSHAHLVKLSNVLPIILPAHIVNGTHTVLIWTILPTSKLNHCTSLFIIIFTILGMNFYYTGLSKLRLHPNFLLRTLRRGETFMDSIILQPVKSHNHLVYGHSPL